MLLGRVPSRARGPASLKATMCACSEKLPPLSVSECSNRYLLHPANSQWPPDRAAKNIFTAGEMLLAGLIANGDRAGFRLDLRVFELRLAIPI